MTEEIRDDIYTDKSLHPAITNNNALILLKYFLTHVDGRPIYGIRHLPPEFVASILARYSRTGKDIAAVLLDLLVSADININETRAKWLTELQNKLLNTEKIRKMHEEYTINFGHESIRKMASGIAVAVDKCSMLAAMNMRLNARIGMQFIERSTRYQEGFLDVNAPGRYVSAEALFPDGEKHKEIRLMYEALIHASITTANNIYKELVEALHKTYPYAESDHGDITEKEWNSWIRNRALDNARYLIPLASNTGIGIVGNAMAYNNLVNKLCNNMCEEFRYLGKSIQEAAAAVAPTLIKEPNPDMLVAKYNLFIEPDIIKMRQHIIDSVLPEDKWKLGAPRGIDDVCYISLDQRHMKVEDVIKFLACLLISRSVNLPVDTVYAWFCIYVTNGKVPKEFLEFMELPGNPAVSDIDFALKIIYKYTGQYTSEGNIVDTRATRVKRLDGDKLEMIGWEKLPRIFEFVNLSFDLMLDVGTWRDLNTHVMISTIDYPITPGLGFAFPDDINLLDPKVKEVIRTVFQMSTQLWKAISEEPGLGLNVAQYAGLCMWNQRRFVRVNLRELDYIISLRTRWQGHFSYRRMAKMLYYRTVELWPTLAKLLRGDFNNYVFGRVIRKKIESRSDTLSIPDDGKDSNAEV